MKQPRGKRQSREKPKRRSIGEEKARWAEVIIDFVAETECSTGATGWDLVCWRYPDDPPSGSVVDELCHWLPDLCRSISLSGLLTVAPVKQYYFLHRDDPDRILVKCVANGGGNAPTAGFSVDEEIYAEYERRNLRTAGAKLTNMLQRANSTKQINRIRTSTELAELSEQTGSEILALAERLRSARGPSVKLIEKGEK